MINELPALKRDYDGDSNICALKRRGFINQESTLGGGLTLQRFPLHEVGLARAAPSHFGVKSHSHM